MSQGSSRRIAMAAASASRLRPSSRYALMSSSRGSGSPSVRASVEESASIKRSNSAQYAPSRMQRQRRANPESTTYRAPTTGAVLLSCSVAMTQLQSSCVVVRLHRCSTTCAAALVACDLSMRIGAILHQCKHAWRVRQAPNPRRFIHQPGSEYGVRSLVTAAPALPSFRRNPNPRQTGPSFS